MNHPKLTRGVLPAFFAINILIFFIYAYALLFVLPQHPYMHPIAILLLLLTESSLYITLSPITLQTYQVVLSSKRHFHQLCKKCSQPRPPRTHHCSSCRQCIPRMSHHCAVLSTCLGAHNMKPFLLLLFYGFVAAFICLALSLPEAIHLATSIYTGEARFTIFHICRAQALYAQFALAISMLGLLIYHCYYISTGWTILEANTVSTGARVCPPWRRSISEFDRGLYKNFVEVFGTGYGVLLPMVEVEKMVCIGNEMTGDVDIRTVV